jgi:hypothetical protein
MRTFLLAGFLSFPVWLMAQRIAAGKAPTPRIVNIVNFIRLLEPRDSAITEDVLYQTVVRQVTLMRKYRLGGTFLLQYDALMDPRYPALLRTLPRDSFEIGAWWELPQPLIEKAGMKWRGRYPWDWHANVGFVTGYTPQERERLIDVYMADFKRIFGYYPASVGSWFIDAHSLAYLYDRYHIVASCNCKDQYGTDGYTLWGGYWNQAYYPSKHNAYMPAQHEAEEIPVPIFRMLGSDPVRQYDNGLGSERQGVVTLEPVYPFGGGDSAWVNWFFSTFARDPDLGFNYTQTGQENSFTWWAMSRGLELQFPLIARLRHEGRVRVETLAASGRWFRKRYAVTPATTFTVTKDIDDSHRKTIWYDSRFYRINLLWAAGLLRIRDIHLFDEQFTSPYERAASNTSDCRLFTLPFVEGHLWSRPGHVAGLWFKAVIDGREINPEGGDPVFTPVGTSMMHIRWPLKRIKGAFEIELGEKEVAIRWTGEELNWYLELNPAEDSELPFESIHASQVDCKFGGASYRVDAVQGRFSGTDGGALRINPQEGGVVLRMATDRE